MSTVTQLLEIHYKFCQAIENQKEVRVIFLDIKKAFDKCWHKGIIHKLSKSGIAGNLLVWFEDYLKNRMQRVVINGQFSDWCKVEAGVPQGSVLGPLLFILYINDITSAVEFANIRLFADDTCLFIEVDNREEAANMIERDLAGIEQWADRWLVDFGAHKTKSLTISRKPDPNRNRQVSFKGHLVEEVQSHTHLGIELTHNLTWNSHIDTVETKARKRLSMLLPLKFKLDRKSIEMMFNAFVLSTMFYGIELWGGHYDTSLQKLEQIIVDGMRLVTGATSRSNIAALYNESSWNSFYDRRHDAICRMMFKIVNNQTPLYLSEIAPVTVGRASERNLRNQQNLNVPFARSETLYRSFFVFGARLWNKLPIETRSLQSLELFKLKLKSRYPEPKILYYYGQRWPSVIHSRLRQGCSKLNFDLHYNLHLDDIMPSCTCGAENEDSHHFLMNCPHYNDLRTVLERKIRNITVFSCDTLLYGCSDLTLDQNKLVFKAVHEFICASGRFT